VIGLNKPEQGEGKVYKAASRAVDLHTDAWQFLKVKNYTEAIPLLEQAAILNLPAAQFDLALTLIHQAQKLEDNSLYITAFAWGKIAANNKQEQASQLLSELEDSFDTRMLHDGLLKYRDIKEQIAARNNE